ncbi:MAG: cysteine--tRNA ligase [Deferribacteres bacterium]|nr:cysteine--tRNA ligase [candidate division KSB1 bacterium]MCB9502621.1 cysteine--tRNA ligase [Deferribacteres bacterium]
MKIYNTLSGGKEEYQPINSDYTGFYVCGPTVYDYFHIGNARPFIVFDVIRRFLIFRGYNVRYVMNLTDIDDKIINRAKADGVTSKEIADRYINAFFEDIQKLGVRPADVYPRATDHINEIIATIKKLVEQDVAYSSAGDVFYDVTKFANYGQLSKKKLDELQAGKRIAVDERKKNSADFVLWKAAKPGEPFWPSPWGNGRPGWHIECSVMSMKYLGKSFDFHGGGQDLIFPHHENEIAQSCAATGCNIFAKYWLHNGFLDMKGEKMSKSLGNFVTARGLMETYPTTAIRLFFLQKHYRGPIDFSEEGLNAATVTAQRLSLTYKKLKDLIPADFVPNKLEETAKIGDFVRQIQALDSDLLAAMEDDFNTPGAIGKLFDIVRETNKFIDEVAKREDANNVLHWLISKYDEYDRFFGIIDKSHAGVDHEQLDGLMQAILKTRQTLRKEKNWALADQLRDDLANAGIVLEDSPSGTTWRWQNKILK